MGTTIGVITGDTRSLDYSSHDHGFGWLKSTVLRFSVLYGK